MFICKSVSKAAFSWDNLLERSRTDFTVNCNDATVSLRSLGVEKYEGVRGLWGTRV